jgi:hypothetical protein
MQSMVSAHSHMPSPYPRVPYTPELGEFVVNELLAGKTQIAIAEDHGWPAGQIGKWATLHTEFAVMLRAARAEAAHIHMDETIVIADTDPDAARARNRIQARQRLAESRNRSAYGPSVDMNVTGQLDMSGTLIEARRRVLPVRDQAQLPDTQVTDYIEVLPERTSDSESAAPVKPPNPFD